MCHGENPSELSTTLFLVFSSQPFILLEGGWGSYCLEGKSMGKFELGRAPNFGMLCFAWMDKKTPEPYASVDPHVHVLDLLSCLRVVGRSGSGIHHHIHFPREWHCGSSGALPVCIFRILRVFCDIVVAAELFLCVSFAFCECFSLRNTVIVVLQHCLKLQSVWDPVTHISE